MKRIILHWTAGSHRVGKVDKRHYHFIVDGRGNVVAGDWPVSANARIVKGKYAAHTRALNTGSIGVSIACMHGAKERPLDFGKYPPTTQQVNAMIVLVAKLCKQYNIPVTRETVLCHSEVQATLGVRQRGKWDINALPWLSQQGALHVGDYLRHLIKTMNAPKPKKVNKKIVVPVAVVVVAAPVLVTYWDKFVQWLGF